MSLEEENQRLRDLVAQLTADKERQQNRTDAEPGIEAMTARRLSNSNAPPPVTAERLIYVPRDRKCPTFRGRTGLTILEWVEEVRACMRLRHLSPVDQALFIYDHLEGEAREEIKYRSREEREDPERVLAVLLELYGCSQSYVSLQEAFFSRKQLDGESLQEFSHALMCLMSKVVQRSPTGMPHSNVLLRDQFVEHVSDYTLRRELKQFVRSKPASTLLEVRGEAIRWEQEGMPGGGRGRSYSVPSAFGTQCAVQGRPPWSSNGAPQSELAELKEMLRNQQEQIAQLTQNFASIQNSFNHPPRFQNSFNRPPPTRKGPVICMRCQKPGHFARECDGERVPSQAPLPPTSTLPARGNVQSSTQPAGN